MRQALIIAFFASLFSIHGYTQAYLYPVKVNHKWGYINQRGKLIVEPKYDLIGVRELPWYNDSKKSSGFRLVQLDDKLGLINRKKQEVLSPKYQRIRPLSEEYFAVVLEEDFLVVNRQEEAVMNTSYTDIQLLGKSQHSGKIYFKIRNQKLWGVYEVGRGVIIPMKYKQIAFLDAGQGLFKAQAASKARTFGILNRANEWVLSPTFRDFKACGQDFIATLGEGMSWGAVDTLGREIFTPKWAEFQTFNQHLMLMNTNTNPKQDFLYSFNKKELFKPTFSFDSIQKLDEQYVLAYYNEMCSFIDHQGKRAIDSVFAAIQPLEYPLYRVAGRGGFGIYNMEQRRMILPHQYGRIDTFQGQVAVVTSRFRTGQGMINRNMEEIIPPQYTSLTLEGNKVKARMGRRLSVYTLDEQARVVNFEDHSRVNTLRVRKRGLDEYLEAKSIRNSRFVQEEESFLEEYKTTFPLDSFPWRWRLDEAYRRQLRFYPVASDTNNFQTILDAKRILVTNKPINTGLVSFAASTFKSRSGIFDILPNRYYRQMQLYDLMTAQQLSEQTYAGVRRYDFERQLPCAAAVKDNGKMVIIDRKGQLLNEQEFTYIGDFKYGLARVCVGGVLEKMSDGADDKYQLEDIASFWQKFCFDALPINHPEATEGIQVKSEMIWVNPNDTIPAKWGFIDTLGNWVIDTLYDYVRDSYDGQMEAVKDRNWGVINRKNEVMIPFEYGHISNYYGAWKTNKRNQGIILFNRKGWELCSYCYEEILPFKAGFCRVQNKGKWGFMNDEGKEIVTCQYQAVRDFSEGLAAVKLAKKWAFIDTTGQVVFELETGEEAGNFHEGKVWMKRKGAYGFLDRKGKVVIEPTYQRAFDFKEGLARVAQNGRMGLIDEKGAFVLTPKDFQLIREFNEHGVAEAMRTYSSGKKGLIDRQGTILAPFQFTQIDTFQEEVAVVNNGRHYGFLHISGELITPMQYYQALPFSNGFALVKRGAYSKWEYIDREGRNVFKRSFPVAHPFANGYASVQLVEGDASTRKVLTTTGKLLPIRALFSQDGIFGMHSKKAPFYGHHYYYGDAKGNNLFDQYFQEINPFIGDYAMVQQHRRRAIIDKRGMMTLRPKYLAVDRLGDGFVLVHPPAFGIVNHAGRTVLPSVFDYVLLVSGDIYRVEQGERIGYVDGDGKWIWELQN
ncbi:MAG: WG repeat-containing protein [Bacteroidota bacterium]